MSQCFNPLCDRKNLSDAKFCHYCGSQLLLGDRFRALKILGQGSFGKTFLAVDESHLDKHRYAVKQFLPLAFTNREKASEMFEQEAKRLETLGQHPQIPTFIGYHEQEDRQYLVQEFIDGNNLLVELAEQGTFTEAKVFRLLNNLLPVLEFIHQHRVIHRDIKPENIIRRRLFLDPFIASSSKVEFVLVDFGAAKHATGSALVKTGTSIGSAEYVAPEQVRGKAEFASDIYSLGVTCIHLLTNTSPFNMIDGDNNWVWRDWLKDNPVSDRLTYILNKMISPQLSQRYAAVALVTADLRNSSLLKSPKKPQPNRKSTWLGISIVGAISISVTAVFLALRSSVTAPYVLSSGGSLEEAAMEQIFNLYKLQTKSYIKNGSFSLMRNYESLLKEGYIPLTKGYKIIVTDTGSNSIRIEALPNQANLKSLVAIVWGGDKFTAVWGGDKFTAKPNSNESMVLESMGALSEYSDRMTKVLYCESDRPTMKKLVNPEGSIENKQLNDQNMQCPLGYSLSETAINLLGRSAAKTLPSRVIKIK